MQGEDREVLAELARLQQRLGEAVTARDPVAYWREHLPSVPLDENGLRLAALLVTKLRFQRLVAACERAERWFAGDPAAFTAAFREYEQEVRGEHLDPWGEAAQFERWCERRA